MVIVKKELVMPPSPYYIAMIDWALDGPWLLLAAISLTISVMSFYRVWRGGNQI